MSGKRQRDAVLEVKRLVKDFGKFRAVDGISFSVPRGNVVGLLGPNGAGKTTTIHMLLGVTLHTAGTIEYFGKDFTHHREASLQRINFASAFNTLQGRISVWENLRVFAELYGVREPKKKILDLVEYFEITPLLGERFWNLSAGEKTRVNLIKSLLNDPELILMDEPTASLDPDIADKTLSLIEDLRRKRNLSILYTSHNMDEVTRICDWVIFLDHGKIVAEDTPLGLTKRITTAKLQLTFDGDMRVVQKFLDGGRQAFTTPSPSVVVIDTEEEKIPQLIFRMSTLGPTMTDIDIKKPTLEDVFLNIARGKHS